MIHQFVPEIPSTELEGEEFATLVAAVVGLAGNGALGSIDHPEVTAGQAIAVAVGVYADI
jgi:hypothetical protein